MTDQHFKDLMTVLEGMNNRFETKIGGIEKKLKIIESMLAHSNGNIENICVDISEIKSNISEIKEWIPAGSNHTERKKLTKV